MRLETDLDFDTYLASEEFMEWDYDRYRDERRGK